MPKRAILIGQATMLERLERQLDLLPDRPRSIGWVTVGPTDALPAHDVLHLGRDADLDSIVATHRPDLALVCLPAAMSERITAIRTRLRRQDVPDRFIPTLEDLVAGVGPRMELDIDLLALVRRAPRTVDPRRARAMIQDRRVLITGAGGSIGSELARLVAAHQPAELLLMERAENALFEIDRQIARRHPDLRRRALLHDVVDRRGTRRHFESLQPELVIHAAAHKHVPMMEDHPAAAVENNLFGTIAVADAADAVGAERFVLISTDKAVNPTSVMGATKRLAELYVQHLNRRSNMCTAIVRFGNVLGSSGSVLETWANQIRDGGPITVTDPAMTRYFMTIPEAAALVLEAAGVADDPKAGEVFVLDMGDAIRVVDLAQSFVAAHGLEPRLPDDDACTGGGSIGIVFTGARPGEKLHEELAFDAQRMAPTSHPDVNAWLLDPPTDAQIRRMIDALGATERPADAAALTQLIHMLVPETGRSASQEAEIKALGAGRSSVTDLIDQDAQQVSACKDAGRS